MKTDWTSLVLDNEKPQDFWKGTFSVLLDISKSASSPVAMQNETTVPDRLLSEAAWELWEWSSDDPRRLIVEVPLLVTYSAFYALVTRAFMLLGMSEFFASEK